MQRMCTAEEKIIVTEMIFVTSITSSACVKLLSLGSTFVLDGENQTSADIVDEFADDYEVWAQAFIEGWQVMKTYHFPAISEG